MILIAVIVSGMVNSTLMALPRGMLAAVSLIVAFSLTKFVLKGLSGSQPMNRATANTKSKECFFIAIDLRGLELNPSPNNCFNNKKHTDND